MKTLNSSSGAPGAESRARLSTRDAILEAAGRVFAERGYAAATSKEICRLAGANGAAVNYHFGGKEKLYEEVLREAHRQMCDLEELDKVLASDSRPEEKLRAFLDRMLRTARISSDLWGIRILLRELASPSAFAVRNMLTTALPKAFRIRSLVHEVTGIPLDSKKLQWAAGFVILPCMSFILFPHVLQDLLLPASQEDHDSLVDTLCAYVLNGLRSLQEK